MNKAVKAVICAVTAVAVAGVAVGVHYGYSKKIDEMKAYTVETNSNPQKMISFRAETDDDFVLGLNNMSQTAQLRLPANLPSEAKYVIITAIDSWGAESNSVTCELNM